MQPHIFPPKPELPPNQKSPRKSKKSISISNGCQVTPLQMFFITLAVLFVVFLVAATGIWGMKYNSFINATLRSLSGLSDEVSVLKNKNL